jgi:hypothetical protein
VVNLGLALASCRDAKSEDALSKRPVFHHRFMKHNLFLESLNTPDLQRFDNWTRLAQEAM